LIGELKDSILRAAMGDIARRDDASGDMLFEGGLGSPITLGERLKR
jgi:hypothetical protein